MTDVSLSLFAEMDQAADLLREIDPHVSKEDLQIEFRQVQQARMPDLNENERLELFNTWIDHYLSGLMAEHAPHVQAARRR